jgi:DNA-binding LacI/PurR family transcriptional regulator
MFIPTLTTVSQPQHTIGYQAMDMLIHQIKGQNYTKRYTVNHEIIYRDSLK